MFKNKISFCTVSMNRLNHIKETILDNIKDNISYKNLEFVLLDYNSDDNLKSWIKSNLSSFIDQGVLKYYRTEEPKSFHRSHSRNVALKLAKGDIVCNLDADNYLGKEFAHYINYQFSFKDKIFLTSGKHDGSFGKVCIKKKDFINVQGYDEKFSGWGYEDEDLYKRLCDYGLERERFFNSEFTNYIEHANEYRVCNDVEVSKVEDIYVSYINAKTSLIYYLMVDNNIKYGTVSSLYDGRELDLIGGWDKGTVIFEKKHMVFKLKDKKELIFFNTKSNKMVSKEGIILNLILDKNLKNKILLLLTGFENKNQRWTKNDTSRVNNFDWGSANLELNFNTQVSI